MLILSKSFFSNLDSIINLTRTQIVALKLPKVAFVADQDVVLAPDTETAVNNPTLAKQRPSEATVEYALSLVASPAPVTGNGVVTVPDIDSDDEETEVTVKIGTLGTFTWKALELFQNMCRLSQDASDINKEQKWLAQTSVLDVRKVKAFLLNAKPHDKVLRQDQFFIDVAVYSTLACERYVNGFAIDALCLKLLDEHKPTKMVYLPTFSEIWAKQGAEYLRHNVTQFCSHCPAKDATCILSPVHFENPQHWGLLCLDVTTTTIYFDDGLKISPQRDILTVIKNMLEGLRVFSGNDNYHAINWNNNFQLSLPLSRIGMPTQPTSGEGAASCGVGVILAKKDIIECGKCSPAFKWCFTNMSHLRKELMILILQW